jgi:hypothetical protein
LKCRSMAGFQVSTEVGPHRSGWALHAFSSGAAESAPNESYYRIVALLVAVGAPLEPEWLTDENARSDPRMFAALTGKTRNI